MKLIYFYLFFLVLIESNLAQQSGTNDVNCRITNSAAKKSPMEIFNIFPKPEGTMIVLYDNPGINSFGVEIKDTIGQTIYHKSYLLPRTSIIEEVDLNKIPRGVYFVEIISFDKKIVKKITLR